MICRMIKFMFVVSAAGVLSPLVSSAQVSGDRNIWQGKYSASERANFSYVASNEWIEVQRSGGSYVRISYREITRTADFIELEMSERPSYRVRLYADRIESKSTYQADRWTKIATGRWVE